MVAGEVESSCQLVVTFFSFFFLVSPYQTIEISLGQLSGAPPSYQLLPPPLVSIDDFVLKLVYNNICMDLAGTKKTIFKFQFIPN